jgi:hypothetical protein
MLLFIASNSGSLGLQKSFSTVSLGYFIKTSKMIKKIRNTINWILEIPSRRRLEKTIEYFERKYQVRQNILFSHYDVTQPPPDDISSFEIVGCLTLYLGTEPVPIDTLVERDIPHRSWISRFDETLFLAIVQTARDFRTMGWDYLSQRLLKYGWFAANKVGRIEWSQEFQERLVRGIRGFYGQRRI